MSWPTRGHGLEQTRYPVAPVPATRPTAARVHVTGGTSRHRRTSVDEKRGLAANSLKAAQRAGRPTPRKMNDLPITPTTQTFPPSLANSTDSPSAASASASLRKERGAIAAQVSAVWAAREPFPEPLPRLPSVSDSLRPVILAVAVSRDATNSGPSAARARSSASSATTESPSRPSMLPCLPGTRLFEPTADTSAGKTRLWSRSSTGSKTWRARLTT